MKNLTKDDRALQQHEAEAEYAILATLSAASQETALCGQGMCAHQLFEAQALRTPDAPALVVQGETLSYAQLNHRANRLAQRLQLLGVGPEVLVGLCLPRTADLPVALLAILKAGGAYVPLDPAYPPDRLRFQIQDSGARLLLTNSSLEHLWQGIEVTHLYLDQPVEEDFIPPLRWDANVESQVHEDHLAYVIYTSGSTGRPKGVCIAHRNTLSLVRWSLRNFTLEDVQGMVAGTSICFDLSIFELFVPWSCGGAVYLVENGLHLPEGEARKQVTLLNMVPSVMAELARTTAIPPSVRVITFCGETLPRPLVERLYELPGVQRIYNLYGPTEDTTYSTWSLLDRDEHGENVPIGYPLDGSQVYLLDPDGQQVPAGDIGELYLGGAGVTRGYWDRPEMTAQRFVPDPFGQQCGARLYRTGDLARYRADGQLEFLGRIDQQVKIRGHRIELGEIESVLHQHDEVQDCVVLARKPESGGAYLILVAYIVPAEQHKDLEPELRTFLQQRLPEYMIPTFFVTLEAMPRTSNGKIDRKALPDPQEGKARRQPRATQTKLAGALNLSAGKKELLKKLLKKEYAATAAAPLSEPEKEAKPGTGEGLFPLSLSQQRYWLIDQLDPGTPLYNIFFASRITGNLDVWALMRTIREIVRRHEPLRTAFFNVDGTPMQRICPPPNFLIPIIDLRSLSDERRQEEEQRLLFQETQSSFDLSSGFLLRVHLLRTADDVFVLMTNIHHIVADGWAIDVFREEMAALYEAFSLGRPSPLHSLPVRFVDYVLWQHQRLQGSLLEGQLEYWRKQLAGPPAPLHLPTDRPRAARQTFSGDIYRFALSPSLHRGLQDLGQSEGVTLFMTLFAGFQVLLCRLSGQEDIFVGTPIIGRTRAGLNELIGCFVNTVVFRTDMQGNPSFRALLQRVRTMALGAYGHQDTSLEQVLHIVRPERGSAYVYAPLFQVMFHFHAGLKSVPREVALNVERLGQKNVAAKFDLSLRIRVLETDEGPAMEGEFLYNTQLFDEGTIIHFARRLHRLYEAAVAQPDQEIWHMPFLPEEERELLIGWNNTHQGVAPQEQATSVLHLFEAQAARNPEATALVVGEEVLSYAQLHHKANQLARYLRRLGVGPEVLVGLCLRCSSDLLVALFAILKAGGAYVPLAPAYSTEHLASILEDAQPTVLITRQGQIVPEHRARVISLDTDWSTIAQESPADLCHLEQGGHLACALYAPCAAGPLKGVMVEHRQLLNYTRAITQRMGIASGFSFALLEPITGNAAVTAIYPTLCAGGTLHMILPEDAHDARALGAYFQRYAIDYLNITPSHLAALHASAPGEPFMPRQCLLLGGEAAAWDWVRKLKAEHPTCTILNQYGPAESTTGATTYLVEQEADRYSHSAAPIGRPLANTRLYILDRSLQQVPIYMSGELYIGGSNVARGYLHHPEVTAEKFIIDPFSAQPDARLYKTGDLARYLPDGNIELLGRIDDQAEGRDFLVEVDDVQNLLSRYPAVRSVAVVASENTSGNTRLIAYVVLREGQTATVSDLREYIAQYLPIRMVPAAFVWLDSLPMTAQGKVDRQALSMTARVKANRRTPDKSEGRAEGQVVSQSEIETHLVHIWENVLQVSPISVHDNFFDQGGNSLLAVRLMAQIRREFQQDLPISVLFQKGTPEQLTAELLRRRWSSTHSALVEFQPQGTKLPFFCVHPVGGEVFCYTGLVQQLGSERPLYGLQVPRQAQQQRPVQTLEEIACAYLAEIQGVQPSGPYLLGGWSMGGVIAFEMAQQLLQQGQEVALLALIDSYTPAGQQSSTSLIRLFGEELEGMFGKKLSIDYGQLEEFTPDEQLMVVYTYAEQADVIPPDLEWEDLRGMFAIYKGNIEAFRRYQPQAYAGRLTLFPAKSGEGATQVDRTQGWQDLARQGCDVQPIPGDHYSILKRPNLDQLVAQLKRSFDEIDTVG